MDFRGKRVQRATMNDEELPFTTELGRDWEPWMAFRELYANALDEGGEVRRSDDGGGALPEGRTRITVDLNSFEAIFFSMEEHFIGPDDQPIATGSEFEVYQGRSKFVFNRGIAVMELEKPAAFRYNIKGHIDLTEDRTAKYSWQVEARLERGLAATSSQKVADVVSDMRSEFEATLDFSRHEASSTFIGATVKNGANANPTAMARVKAQIPNDGAVSVSTTVAREQPGGENLLYALAIFDKRDKMVLAVIEGYGAIAGNSWAARRLYKLALDSVGE